MGRKSSNEAAKTKILATKKASTMQKEVAPLSFKKVSNKELQASRNKAYNYLVK